MIFYFFCELCEASNSKLSLSRTRFFINTILTWPPSLSSNFIGEGGMSKFSLPLSSVYWKSFRKIVRSWNSVRLKPLKIVFSKVEPRLYNFLMKLFIFLMIHLAFRYQFDNSIAICGCLKCPFSSSGSFGFCQTFD